MFVPKQVVSWFESFQASAAKQADVAQQALIDLREELVAARTERDLLRTELHSAKINSDWLRIRVNALEMENKGLLEKAYNIRLPVPEIARTPEQHNPLANFSFDDMGDELASKLGLPIYGKA